MDIKEILEKTRKRVPVPIGILRGNVYVYPFWIYENKVFYYRRELVLEKNTLISQFHTIVNELVNFTKTNINNFENCYFYFIEQSPIFGSISNSFVNKVNMDILSEMMGYEKIENNLLYDKKNNRLIGESQGLLFRNELPDSIIETIGETATNVVKNTDALNFVDGLEYTNNIFELKEDNYKLSYNWTLHTKYFPEQDGVPFLHGSDVVKILKKDSMVDLFLNLGYFAFKKKYESYWNSHRSKFIEDENIKMAVGKLFKHQHKFNKTKNNLLYIDKSSFIFIPGYEINRIVYVHNFNQIKVLGICKDGIFENKRIRLINVRDFNFLTTKSKELNWLKLIFRSKLIITIQELLQTKESIAKIEVKKSTKREILQTVESWHYTDSDQLSAAAFLISKNVKIPTWMRKDLRIVKIRKSTTSTLKQMLQKKDENSLVRVFLLMKFLSQNSIYHDFEHEQKKTLQILNNIIDIWFYVCNKHSPLSIMNSTELFGERLHRTLSDIALSSITLIDNGFIVNKEEYKRILHFESENQFLPSDYMQLIDNSLSNTVYTIKNKVLADKFKKAVNSYSYSNVVDEEKGLAIIHPEEISDLKTEGSDLGHCVASYIERVANRTTEIYFLRKINNLKRPYITIEVRNGQIRQAHGKGNSNIVSKSKEDIFLRKWAADNDIIAKSFDGVY